VGLQQLGDVVAVGECALPAGVVSGVHDLRSADGPKR
jgi:hypothetical protein